MAILHSATLRPTKAELLATLLATRSWGEPGRLRLLGAYRFDDPAGAVGVECHLVAVGETVFHLPLTYREAPLTDGGEPTGAEEASHAGEDPLVGTMEHSVLGTRYVYDALGDEVALECFARALAGEQRQAVLQVQAADGTVTTREQTVQLRLEIDEGENPPSLADLEDGEPFTVARTVGDLDGTVRLVAAWDGGEGVVAAC